MNRSATAAPTRNLTKARKVAVGIGLCETVDVARGS